MESIQKSRTLEALYCGVETSDGAGVKLCRLLDKSLHARLDPFLMFDAFGSDTPDEYIAGFPDHPHRGFETVTYMRQGRMQHHDSAGHSGVIEGGGMQWMSAARGVIHSEMPLQEDGRLAGFQLWINLPARDKMNPPWYRDFTAAQLPRFTRGGVNVTVISGQSHGVDGAIMRAPDAPLYLDLHFAQQGRFSQTIAPMYNAFVYVERGAVEIAGQTIKARQLAVLSNDALADGVHIDAENDSQVLLLAGQPLNERIVQYGPFVMNSEQEIYQAIKAYREGNLT